MSEVVAEVLRGGQVESVHHGVVVAVDVAGSVVAAAGDPERFAYFRSSAKPFQAVPLVESGAADRFGFTPAELALCCASHRGEPHHQAQVAAMLAKLGLDAGALRCGAPLPADPEEAARVRTHAAARTPLQCDCSGKHAGVLATCLHHGEPVEGYLDPEHPAQRRILAAVAAGLRLPPETITIAVDGCGLPTYGAPTRAFAAAFATLAAPDRAPAGQGREHAAALHRLRAAMIAHPENVSGAGNLVTNLMAIGGDAVVAKSGAEGLLCLGFPARGIGLAIRTLDGSFRSHAVIAAAAIRQLDLLPGETVDAVLDRHPATLRNHVGREVGELRAAFDLTAA